MIQDSHGKRIWMECECGTVFQAAGQSRLPDADRSADYKAQTRNDDWWADRSSYLKKIYFPLLEDATHGRKILVANHVNRVPLDWMRNRGWIAYGADACPASNFGGPGEQLDFMEARYPKPYQEFSVVWLESTINRYDHPIPVLARAFSLLESTGLCFISSPDTAFLHRKGKPEWGHYHPIDNRIMLRGEMLAKLAERVGFDTVLLRKSDSRRGLTWGEYHWIGVKK